MVTETPVYITSTEELEKANEKLARAPIIAVDLEADSMYHFEEKVCLLQMATDKSCFIIDPLAVTDLSPLAPVFSDKNTIKIFHGSDYDVRSLYRDFGFRIENLFDTELACRFLGYPRSSLEAVLKLHFNVTLDKKYQKKDWSIRPLPEEMIAYAANDVRYLVDLYHHISKALAEKERLDWALETCEVICRSRPEGNNGEDKPLFTGIKGAGRLDPRSLAVLEKLAFYRQQVAKKKDRPPYKIMSNTAIMEIARKKPQTMAQLSRSALLSKKQVQMYGSSVVQAVLAAIDIPEENLPRYPKTQRSASSPVVSRRIDALKKWRERKARQLEMDPAMLINNTAIKTIAKQEPKTLPELKSVEILRNWQVETFGEQWIKTIVKTA